MSPLHQTRAAHYLLLLTAAVLLYLPGLGVPSLWDIDEGNNAECACEMRESGNWIVPTFNHQLRTDKPALLYWCQVAAYHLCGVGEFAARLPSAAAALLTVLLTYELGRRMFGALAGLLAGLALASALLFGGSAHFANPDALLNACTMLTFLLFWDGYTRDDPGWLAWVGVSTGLGFLAKGPVGLVLPLAVINLYLLWARQWRQWLRPRMLLGVLLWVLVAVPWYALVGAETKGEFLRGFFGIHNLERALQPMEGHGGPVYYHALSLLLGFLPWSVFLLPTVRNAVREARSNDDGPRQATRFLACWIAVYFVSFSISRTKLPNYILPLYPAVALLTGRFLDRWRRGEIAVRRSVLPVSLGCWALVGMGLTLGLLVVSGALDVPQLQHHLPGMEEGAWLGVLPLVGAGGAWLCLRRGARGSALGWLATTAVLFGVGVFTWGGPALDAHKAPRPLVAEAVLLQPERDIRIGCYGYFQPSLVFYCQRKVEVFTDEKQVRDFLRCPLPAYLFVPADVWDGMAAQIPGTTRLLGRHWDLYRRCEVLVIGNAAE